MIASEKIVDPKEIFFRKDDTEQRRGFKCQTAFILNTKTIGTLKKS